jgi:hypothetical protein
MVEELEAFLGGKTLLRRLPTLAEGANVVQQSVKAGLLDELQRSTSPPCCSATGSGCSTNSTRGTSNWKARG